MSSEYPTIKRKNGVRQMKLRTFPCTCDATEHTVNVNIEPWREFLKIWKKHGEFITIIDMKTKKYYKVSRMYIAKHGIKTEDLEASGFPLT